MGILHETEEFRRVDGAHKAITLLGWDEHSWMAHCELGGAYEALLSTWGLCRWKEERRPYNMMSTACDYVLRIFLLWTF